MNDENWKRINVETRDSRYKDVFFLEYFSFCYKTSSTKKESCLPGIHFNLNS